MSDGKDKDITSEEKDKDITGNKKLAIMPGLPINSVNRAIEDVRTASMLPKGTIAMLVPEPDERMFKIAGLTSSNNSISFSYQKVQGFLPRIDICAVGTPYKFVTELNPLGDLVLRTGVQYVLGPASAKGLTNTMVVTLATDADANFTAGKFFDVLFADFLCTGAEPTTPNSRPVMISIPSGAKVAPFGAGPIATSAIHFFDYGDGVRLVVTDATQGSLKFLAIPLGGNAYYI